jgi:hypothetical protein
MMPLKQMDATGKYRISKLFDTADFYYRRGLLSRDQYLAVTIDLRPVIWLDYCGCIHLLYDGRSRHHVPRL